MKTEKKRLAFLLGGALAGLLFLAIYGVRILDVTYDDWLFFGLNRKDLVQHYMGWVNFRKSPWHFPIGLTDGIIYPDRISVVYTDSIPYFAVFFKLLSPLLPKTFQYFGWYGLLCAILLGGFSARLICRMTEDVAYSLLTSLFFSVSVFFLIRTFWHTALASQWIVVAALEIWLTLEQQQEDKKSAARWSGLSLMALLTEAYFLPMVWGIFLCSMLSHIIENRGAKKAWRRLLTDVFFSAGVTLMAGAILGVFYGSVSVSDSLLGLVSFNYNGFINPQKYSSFFSGLPLYDNGQYEGYAYLGLGMSLLIILSAVGALIRLKKRWVESDGEGRREMGLKALPYLLFFAGFIGFAGSPVITVGDHAIALPLPGFVYTLWSVFRSTGRLIWPVCYFLMLFGCVGWYRMVQERSKADPPGLGKRRIRYPRVLLFGVATAALGCQLLEESGYIIELHKHYTADYEYESALTDPAWEEIAEAYDHIMVYPPTIVVNLTPMADELMIFAQKHDMTMSAVYLARDITAPIDEKTMAYFDSGAYKEDEDTVYVFFGFVEPQGDYDLHYYELEKDVVIGVKEPLATKGAKDEKVY
ncbi:MAG: DUF6311 domain-containing protein [Lachnospiraceae bacterium]|nr:DUF6311 domain-containing protein [Lachnospiraceae bacterium]